MKLIIFITLVLMFNMFGYPQDKETEITVKELLKGIKENPSLIVLDVRTSPELTGPLGHLDGIIHIPLQELDGRLQELTKYKDKEIAVICRTGNRSGTATRILRNKGYNAKNVLGGMVEYRRK